MSQTSIIPKTGMASFKALNAQLASLIAARTELKGLSKLAAELPKLQTENDELVFDYDDPKDEKKARSHVANIRTLKADAERARVEETGAIKGVAAELTAAYESMIQAHQVPLDKVKARRDAAAAKAAQEKAEAQRKEQEEAAEADRVKAEADRLERERKQQEQAEVLRAAREATAAAEAKAAQVQAELDALKKQWAKPDPAATSVIAPGPTVGSTPVESALYKYENAAPTPPPKPVIVMPIVEFANNILSGVAENIGVPVACLKSTQPVAPAQPVEQMPPAVQAAPLAPGAITMSAIRARGMQVVGTMADDAHEDVIKEAMLKVFALCGVAKEIKEAMDTALIAWLQKNNRDIQLSHMKYYMGGDTTTKPRSKAKVLDVVMELAQGDMEKAAELLSSDPFKHGSIKGILNDPARYIELFEVTKATDKTKLKIINTEFMKGKSAQPAA